MSIPWVGRSLGTRDTLLSLSLLAIAVVCTMTGYRWDLLACYAIAVLLTRGRPEHKLLNILHIEHSDVPIHGQIRDQVLRAIGAGILKPGEKMPTTRQVAVALRIDFNTVRHAYDMLAQAGAIAFEPTHGMCIASPAPEPKPAEPADCQVLALATYASARAAGRIAPRSAGDSILNRNETEDGS